jgi:sec-independent protein translocase protein TatC
LAFEIPFLMVAAVKTNFVKRQYFTRKRKYYYPGILFLALLLAAGDLMAAVLLALPLCGLYETGILVISLFTKAEKNDQTAEDESDSE